MAEYQNIFTRIQVRGPIYAGTPLEGNAAYGRGGVPTFNHLFGRLGDAQVGPIYSRHDRIGRLDMRLRCFRDHRPKHVGIRGVGPCSVRSPTPMAGARTSCTQLWIALSAAGTGWLVVDGWLFPHRVDHVVVDTYIPPRARARPRHAHRLGVRRRNLAVSGAGLYPSVADGKLGRGSSVRASSLIWTGPLHSHCATVISSTIHSTCFRSSSFTARRYCLRCMLQLFSPLAALVRNASSSRFLTAGLLLSAAACSGDGPWGSVPVQNRSIAGPGGSPYCAR